MGTVLKHEHGMTETRGLTVTEIYVCTRAVSNVRGLASLCITAVHCRQSKNF